MGVMQPVIKPEAQTKFCYGGKMFCMINPRIPNAVFVGSFLHGNLP